MAGPAPAGAVAVAAMAGPAPTGAVAVAAMMWEDERSGLRPAMLERGQVDEMVGHAARQVGIGERARG